jgi:fibro-slime domain-containing protein
VTPTSRCSVLYAFLLACGAITGVQGCGGSSKSGGPGDGGPQGGKDGGKAGQGGGGGASTGGVTGSGGSGPGGVGGGTSAQAGGGAVGTGGGTPGQGGGGIVGTGGGGPGGLDGGALGGSDGGIAPTCGQPGTQCCAGNTCTDGCCVDGKCLASSACIGAPDGGQTDAPIGGSGGTPGTGGIGGAGGTAATGVGGSGGAGGTTTTVQTGGTGGTTTPWTVPAACGDGVVTPPERCDDGNTLPFDGCSSDCQIEPDCSGSSCTSKCGDGIVIGEECDDGNTADGDGCSSSCKVESGFTCTQPPLGDKILVPVVYRDFKFHHPADFESGTTGSYSAFTGMVNRNLDADGKPVFSGLTGGGIAVESETTFATWYRNTDGVNHATASMMALWSNGSGAYVNRYGANGEQWAVTETASWCGLVGSEVLDGSGRAIPCTYQTDGGVSETDCNKAEAKGEQMVPGSCKADSSGTYKAQYIVAKVDGNPLFFPVDNDSFSSSERTGAQIPSEPANMYDATGAWPWDADAAGTKILHNFSFTSEIRYWFKYEADRTYQLDIVGDDDVWVFVNKKLAVDVGGIHAPVVGSATLDSTTATTYGLSPGNVYEVAVFQAERQTTSSTLKITLTGFNTAHSECHAN